MKKLSVLVALFIISFSAAAQKESSETLAKKFLEVSGHAQLGIQSVNMMIDNFKQNLPTVPDTFWNEFSKELKADDLVTILVPVYVKHYTDDDLRKLIEFYSSPVGQKVVAKLPVINQESFEVGQAWGKQIGEKIANRLKEEGYLKEN